MRVTQARAVLLRMEFVHEFRSLAATEIRQLLEQRWTPLGVHLPPSPWTRNGCVDQPGSDGNFRLLNRLLTQIERILEINHGRK
jgi:hypothetical protein